MAFNPIVKIIGIGALASISACTGSKKTGENQPETVVDPKTETVVTKTESTDKIETPRFSKDCVKEYDTKTSCEPNGMVCPAPASMEGGVCPPPDEYRCIEGKWEMGPMPTCNPPPVQPRPERSSE